ncbi:MAG TPA: hypothetical protein VHE57_07785 [Mycobacteriales bacterium]|nr:hypothetical protein [Mycobacteriales bacterium]
MTPGEHGPERPPGEADQPVPYLRRDPNPSSSNGRKVLIAAAVFFVLLVGFVLALVFTIGVNNHGVVIPPGSDTRTGSPR